jgi:hypothetical protein
MRANLKALFFLKNNGFLGQVNRETQGEEMMTVNKDNAGSNGFKRNQKLKTLLSDVTLHLLK